jgi:hypothetical protein
MSECGKILLKNKAITMVRTPHPGDYKHRTSKRWTLSGHIQSQATSNK